MAQVHVIVAGQAPHKTASGQSSAASRIEMARLAFPDMERLVISDEELRAGGPSYTVDTLRRHRSLLGADAKLSWLVGSDSLLDLRSWRSPSLILQLAEILTVPRPGFRAQDICMLTEFSKEEILKLVQGILAEEAPELSSTELREKILAGVSVEDRVDKAVLTYIRQEHLYAS